MCSLSLSRARARHVIAVWCRASAAGRRRAAACVSAQNCWTPERLSSAAQNSSCEGGRRAVKDAWISISRTVPAKVEEALASIGRTADDIVKTRRHYLTRETLSRSLSGACRLHSAHAIAPAYLKPEYSVLSWCVCVCVAG